MFNKNKGLRALFVLCVKDDGMVIRHKRFDVPPKGYVEIDQINGDLSIYDCNKRKTKHINWKAGQTQEYTFVYEKG